MKIKFITNKLNYSIIAITLLHATAVKADDASAKASRVASSRFRNSPNFSPYIMPGYIQPSLANGDIKISNTEVTGLMSDQMKQYFRQREEDAKYLENTLTSINKSIGAFLTDIVINKLEQKSIESSAGKLIDADSFLKLRSEYKSARNAIELDVKKLEGISQGSLPSASKLQITENTTTDLPAWRDFKAGPMISYYMKKLEAVDQEVDEKLKFWVNDYRDVPSEQSLNNINAKFRMMSEAQRVEKQALADKKKKLPLPYLKAAIALHKTFVEQIMNYTKMFGADEKWRWRTPEDIEARNKELIVMKKEVFFPRDYYRARTGLPQGAVKVNYTKRFGKIEEFLQSPLSYSQFDLMPLLNQTQVKVNIENSRKAFQVASKRTSSIFTGTFNPFTNLNSAITFARGYSPQMVAAQQMLELIAADTYEESLMYTPTGQIHIAEYYKNRYYINDAVKADIKTNQEKVYLASWKGLDSNAGINFNVGDEAGSIASGLTKLYRQFILFQDSYNEGLQIQAMIDQFSTSGDSKMEDEREDRLK